MDQERGDEERVVSEGDDVDRSRVLAPEAQTSSRWLASLRKARLPLLAAAVVAIGGALVGRHFLVNKQPSCREIWDKDLGYDLAVITCQREYDRTNEPSTGVILANALFKTDNQAAAGAVAHALSDTKARPDALLLLGKIATREDRNAEALLAFAEAEKLYSAAGDILQTSKTVLASAYILFNEQRFIEALEQLDRCAHLARQAGSKTIEASCLAAAARTLAGMGAEELAWQQIEKARELHPETFESQAPFLIADMMQESSENQHWRATARFEAALATIERVKNKTLTARVHLNLAFSFASLGKLTDAEDQLERARIANSEKDLPGSTLSVAGFIELKKKNFAVADRLLSQSLKIFVSKGDWDDIFETANDLAFIALSQGALAEASEYARQSISAIEQILSRQAAPLYRSWLSFRYRRGYELLFVALAKQGRGEEALDVVDRWLGRDAFDSLTPGPPMSPELGESVAASKALSAAYHSLQKTEIVAAHSSAELHQRLQGQDLITLLVAEGELWRASSHDGAVTMTSLGQYAGLARDLIDRFKMNPFDRDVATAIGAMIIPPEIMQGRAPLHVVLDERLTTIPVEAMRLNGKLVLERRPIVRALRPSLVGCEAPITSSPRVTVVADSSGDLPFALQAAESVARRFETPAHTGQEAKRALLADPADLLHIGVHGNIDASGAGTLSLADGRESAVDIATRGSSPKVIFLAACKSALAEHGGYSLAASFLVAGAAQVVAALNYVDDELAAEVTAEFYKNDGARDPAAALAAALVAVATKQERNAKPEWPRFALFGRATCKVGAVPQGI